MNTQEKTGDNPLRWEDCPGVERRSRAQPRRVHGAWTLEDTRLPLHGIFENLAAGATIHEVTQWFEGVSEAQVKAVLAHVAHMLEKDRISGETQQ